MLGRIRRIRLIEQRRKADAKLCNYTCIYRTNQIPPTWTSVTGRYSTDLSARNAYLRSEVMNFCVDNRDRSLTRSGIRYGIPYGRFLSRMTTVNGDECRTRRGDDVRPSRVGIPEKMPARKPPSQSTAVSSKSSVAETNGTADERMCAHRLTDVKFLTISTAVFGLRA